MTSPRPSLLIDLRDDSLMRGFHALASLYLIADRLGQATLYRLGGDTNDEEIARRVFLFDTGLHIHKPWRLPFMGQKFDLYLCAANTPPEDARYKAAKKAAKRTILALMYRPFPEEPDTCLVMSGHDTSAIAGKVSDSLQLSAPAAAT